ncbi:MAG: hypothetical protein V2I63_09680 [Pseudomonadales bacterium]|jgi:hypothetical protein|nr:hypothetical protein [Pseudomonadales bacterium]
MKRLLSFDGGLEAVAVLLTLAGAGAVVQTFVIGRHFVIPTLLLVPTLLFGNLAWHGARGRAWARHLLFWIGVLASAHLFFALFWAKTPRELLGGAFLPVYGVAFVAMSGLTVQYARRNHLPR